MDKKPTARIRRLSLKTNFAWISVGESVDVFCRWGLILAMTRLMGVEAVGLFGLSMVVVVPVIAFCNLGLRHAQSSDVSREYQFGHYFALRSVTNGLALLVIAALAWSLDLGADGWMVVLLFGISRVIEAQSDAYYGLFQFRERMDYIGRSRMLRGPLALALFTLAIVLSGDLRLGCVGLIGAALIMLIFHDMRLARRLLASADSERQQGGSGPPTSDGAAMVVWDPARLIALARQVLPLGCIAALTALQLNAPRYMVEQQLGLEALGYFTAVAAPYSAITRMVYGLGHSASARLAFGFAQGRSRDFLLLLAKLGGVGVVIGVVGILVTAIFGREILTLLYTPEYGDFADILVLVMIAALFRNVAGTSQFGIIAARRFLTHMLQQIGVAAAAVVGSFLLIPPYGLIGAAYVIILIAVVHLTGVVLINTALVRKLAARREM